MATLAGDDLRIIDADTHFTEPYDLWTSRAPAAYKDRVLHIEQRDEGPTWVVDGVDIGFAKGGGVVAGLDRASGSVSSRASNAHCSDLPGLFPARWRASRGTAKSAPATKRKSGPKLIVEEGPTKYSPRAEDSK